MTEPVTSDQAGRWVDLRLRLASAAVLVAVGGGALLAGGLALKLLAVAAVVAMVWELARMTALPGQPDFALPLALLAGLVLALNLWLTAPWPLALLLAPALAGVLMPRRDGALFAAWAAVIVFTGTGLVALREGAGLAAALVVVLTVIASDVAGYFVGRLVGGPKFWPALSPKKTWSGTAAGWLAAAALGLLFALAGQGGAALVLALPLVAFAGQMGDIAESWVKRRAGVKDASNLIPGHGGVLDRFDALSFAVIAALVLDRVVPFLPHAAG